MLCHAILSLERLDFRTGMTLANINVTARFELQDRDVFHPAFECFLG